ncbi:MAG: ATP-binding protein [Sandaracinaceae bacterium]|nr:ATP-binding protein [Sandaracinaceae bacterium]
MDAATSMYDRLTTEDEIEALAKSTPEKDHLEFKRRSEPNKPLAEDKGARADIAEALSGFANSAGGVLVIGVDDKTGDLRPMPNLTLAEKQLHRELSTAVYPPVIGATAKRIATALDPDAGYLVLLVPASEEGPHQAQMKGKKVYFMRAGESFVQMHHNDLELRFGRPPRPALRLRGSFHYDKNEDIQQIVGVVSLVNSGRGVARDPMVAIRRRESALAASGPHLWVREPHFYRPHAERDVPPLSAIEFWSEPRVRVYPEHTLECFIVQQHTAATELLPDTVLVIEAQIYAENMRPTKRRLSLSREQYEALGPREITVEDEPL